MTPNPPESLNLSSSSDMINNQKISKCPFLRNQMQLPAAKISKPFKITNTASNAESFDMLHKEQKNSQPIGCSDTVCQGNIMFGNVASTTSREPQEIIEHACDFMDQFFKSRDELNSMQHHHRMSRIEEQVYRTGTYDLTSDELLFGAKTAWRNAARCIGRIQWNKLKLFDYRHITTAKEMFDALCEHMDYCQNGGNLLSAITFFPHRTDPSKDFRIWNSQLLSYAAYENEDGTITGDPISLEFTKLCIKLGWKPKRTEYDILPLVLSANGNDPEMFQYPEGFVLEVPMTHPKLEWFEKLKLKWYAIPAISNMQVDCGGLIFPGCAFSGWYTSSEIGCRDLLDPNRRNLIKPIAVKMGLNTRNLSTLWKDKVMLEVNIAVLHSFQKAKVTIVDHHTASEIFMKHLENETKARGGCPADKMFIIPPMSASATRVYHQEMLNYRLRPSFEYQESAYKTHTWKISGEITEATEEYKKTHKLKDIARFVMFANILYRATLRKRVKATILFATETGKSQLFAEQLVKPLSYVYDVELRNMCDFKTLSLEEENLLFCVAATTGNGDAPESAEKFLTYLNATTNDECNKKCIFSVFALGSSAYPNFCAFGKKLDNLLQKWGGQRLSEVTLGDEMCNQDQDYQKWATDIFKITSNKFKLDITHVPKQLLSMENSNFTEFNSRLQPTQFLYEDAIDEALSRFHNKNIITCHVKNQPMNLMTKVEDSCVLVQILIDENEFKYEPGDHVAVCPANNTENVDELLKKFEDIVDPDETVRLQIIDDVDSNERKLWQNHSKIPTCSVRTMFTRFLDITTTPSKQVLAFLAAYCKEETEKSQMKLLASSDEMYEDWKSNKSLNLLEIFDEFPSCRPPIAPLIARLNPLQPRYYSISSSQKKHSDEVHLTVGVVKYTKNGQKRYGICSNYLKNLRKNEEVQIYYQKANSFHLPSEPSAPMILIGPGTGIAPFRSFWQELDTLKKYQTKHVLLFTGHKTKSHEIYKLEKSGMLEKNILTENNLALSRDPSVNKTYVQNLLLQQSQKIYRLVKHENAHVYICGESRMADDIHQTFRKIIESQENVDETSAEQFMQKLKEQSRYHKDTFGSIHRADRDEQTN